MSCLLESLLNGDIPEFDDFLELRRKLMAQKIKPTLRGFEMMTAGLDGQGGRAMTERNELLASIAATTADYREGDLAAPAPRTSSAG